MHCRKKHRHTAHLAYYLAYPVLERINRSHAPATAFMLSALPVTTYLDFNVALAMHSG